MYDWAKHVADKSRHPGAFKKNRYQEDGAKQPVSSLGATRSEQGKESDRDRQPHRYAEKGIYLIRAPYYNI